MNEPRTKWGWMFDKDCYVGPRATDAFGEAVQAMYGRIRDLERELAAAMADAQRLRASERRLKAMIPLFEEARDALAAIPLASAKLRGVRLDLADRMDDVGVPSRWEVIDAAMREKARK